MMYSNVKLLEERPRHIPGSDKVRGRKMREGVAYEKYVHSVLQEIYGSRFYGNPWFEFQVGGKKNWCSPDFLLFPEDLNQGVVVVGECKLTYKPKAWAKYEELYKPIVQSVFSGYVLRGVQVCRHLKRGMIPSGVSLHDLGTYMWGENEGYLVVNHRN